MTTGFAPTVNKKTKKSSHTNAFAFCSIRSISFNPEQVPELDVSYEEMVKFSEAVQRFRYFVWAPFRKTTRVPNDFQGRVRLWEKDGSWNLTDLINSSITDAFASYSHRELPDFRLESKLYFFTENELRGNIDSSYLQQRIKNVSAEYGDFHGEICPETGEIVEVSRKWDCCLGWFIPEEFDGQLVMTEHLRKDR